MTSTETENRSTPLPHRPGTSAGAEAAGRRDGTRDGGGADTRGHSTLDPAGLPRSSQVETSLKADLQLSGPAPARDGCPAAGGEAPAAAAIAPGAEYATSRRYRVAADRVAAASSTHHHAATPEGAGRPGPRRNQGSGVLAGLPPRERMAELVPTAFEAPRIQPGAAP